MKKATAIFFTLFALGAMSETFRIATSTAKDISENRNELLPIALVITTVFVVLAIIFWRKSLIRKF